MYGVMHLFLSFAFENASFERIFKRASVQGTQYNTKKELMLNKKYKNGEKEERGGAVCIVCAKNYANY
jgi:hypothetical protein